MSEQERVYDCQFGVKWLPGTMEWLPDTELPFGLDRSSDPVRFSQLLVFSWRVAFRRWLRGAL